ncbi:MAG TPA: hypothetical protein PL185_07320 [Flavobacteriales bacterium]|mgnify:CR=1 FL=1|jgi:hypothetical protein|nr:hypothetical protein [Flavobacteriales bacterium]HPH82367.1 hypothetical protein [Flavobacteriales bacterium]
MQEPEEFQELTDANFFTVAEVYQLTEMVNETLASVSYHYWVNRAQGQLFEVLDWITFHFDSGRSLSITAGPDSDGIKVSEPNIEAERKRLEEEFKGVVTVETRNASKIRFWKDAIGKSITPSFIKHEGKVLNDSVVLKFEGAEPVEIFLGLEGLEVDDFDEED